MNSTNHLRLPGTVPTAIKSIMPFNKEINHKTDDNGNAYRNTRDCYKLATRGQRQLVYKVVLAKKLNLMQRTGNVHISSPYILLP